MDQEVGSPDVDGNDALVKNFKVQQYQFEL